MKKYVLLYARRIKTIGTTRTVIKTLSLQECIDFTTSQREYKTGKLEIDYQRQFKRAATEIPKNKCFILPRVNSTQYKKMITALQSHKKANTFPAVFTAHKRTLSKTYIKGSEYKLVATRRPGLLR